MNYKQLQKRIVGLLSVFIWITLSNFSCRDHVDPGTHLPSIVTVSATATPATYASNDFEFTLKFADLGAQKIIEYGMVYSFYGPYGMSTNPTLDEAKANQPISYSLVFNSAPDLIEKSIKINRSIMKKEDIDVYFRAYVLLENNSVVYGETKKITFDNDIQ